MAHNRECPKCGTIGDWNWAKEREEHTMPNDTKEMLLVPVKGEGVVKCPKCGYTFEPKSHALLEQKLRKVFG